MMNSGLRDEYKSIKDKASERYWIYPELTRYENAIHDTTNHIMNDNTFKSRYVKGELSSAQIYLSLAETGEEIGMYSKKVYDELSTKHILVMEYIGGFELTDKAAMEQQGYDVQEVCTKFINNYIKQFAEDRFFHADPHPGNVHIWDGRIVWLDLGMMGTLTKADAELIKVCMKAIFSNDYVSFADAVLNICEHDPELDREAYYARMQAYLDKYRVLSMAQMSSTVDIFADLYRIARDFGIKVPKSFTMFWRSLSIMEGTVSDLSPKTDLAAIIGRHMAAQAMVKGVAGSITRKISHRRLVSGSALHYNGNDLEPDEEFEEGINEPEEWLDGDTEE